MPKKFSKGVFCLEGDWDPDLRVRKTVEPILDLLRRSNVPPVDSVRRDIGTIAEFEYYLRKWSQRKYSRFPLLYLGFHGSPGLLNVGDHTDVALDWLEAQLAGKCRGRVIHFGSCGTMATNGHRLNRFLRETGALAICGYKVDVDWMLAAAFEVILLSGFQRYTLTRKGMEAVRRRISKESGALARDLSFRMEIAKG